MTHEKDRGPAMSAAPAPVERRCGTCKRWKPRQKRDAGADLYYGTCKWEPPAMASCVRGINKLDTAHIGGDTCPKWLAGGKHGALK